jgi:hypothetical protein
LLRGSTWQTYDPVKYSSRNIRNNQRIRRSGGRRLHRQGGRLFTFEDAINTAADRRVSSNAGKPAASQATVGDRT